MVDTWGFALFLWSGLGGKASIHLSESKIRLIPWRMTSVRVRFFFSAYLFRRAFVSSSMRTLMSIFLGLSDFGLPILGLIISPHFSCSDKFILVYGTQKIKRFFKFLQTKRQHRAVLCDIMLVALPYGRRSIRAPRSGWLAMNETNVTLLLFIVLVLLLTKK